jgi:hypothetical protein
VKVQGSGQETAVHITTARHVWNKVHDRNFMIYSIGLPGVIRAMTCTRLKHNKWVKKQIQNFGGKPP